MSISPLDTSCKSPKKLDFRVLLRKERRAWGYYTGNRNPLVAAHVYYSMIARDYRNADRLLCMHRFAKSAREAEYIEKRTRKVVYTRWSECVRWAAIQLRGWHHNAVLVLAQMKLYGYQTGYCSAAQGHIAAALDLSRKAVNQWVGRLREAGIIERVSYDSRGSFVWRGREYTSWCHVYAFLTNEVEKIWGYTIPKSRSFLNVPRREYFSDMPKQREFRLPDV